ncbi:hypothetical protein COPEUT_01083 [Coprococcus eutactus ATCC 27759]|nr:hypothetical protein COPEUT_01083 [Coprococcus eutactus ATCC 27759]
MILLCWKSLTVSAGLPVFYANHPLCKRGQVPLFPLSFLRKSSVWLVGQICGIMT